MVYSNLKYIWQFSFLKHSEVDVYGLLGIGIKGIYVPSGRDKGAKLGSGGEFGVGVAYNSIRFDAYVNGIESGLRAAIMINETTKTKYK